MQDQLDEGDYELDGRKEKTLLDKLHKKLTTQLKIMDIDLDDKKERYKYLSAAPVLANMYLLIKVHKKNFPGRAVVNQTDDPTYKICKILTDILNPLAIQSRSYIENSFELKKVLKSVAVAPDDIQASFDVRSLYPSIPIQKTLQITRERLYADDKLADRTKWNPDDIIKLLEICLETHFKTLDGRIYTQTDGTPIGKSISGPLADIYMDWFENEYIYSDSNEFRDNIKIWKRSRDDIYILWNGGEEALDCFFWRVNYIDPRIQFTIERENNRVLPFLDMSLKRYPNKIETKIYRKETHTQKYIHWKSNHSKNCKLGILKGLIHRAHLLCDRKEDLLEEIQLLKDVFIANGYPKKLVEKTVNQSWKTELEKEIKRTAEEVRRTEQPVTHPDEEETSEYYDCLYAPYIQGFSEKLQKDLKSLNVGVAFKTTKTLFCMVCKLRPKREVDDQKNVVYHIPCNSCMSCYIGETGNKFSARKYQHEYDIKTQKKKNGIGDHMRSKKHKINWTNRTFFAVEKDWKLRRIKESIFLNSLNPSTEIDASKLMNPEKGMEMAECWKEFNPIVRDLLKKATSKGTPKSPKRIQKRKLPRKIGK